VTARLPLIAGLLALGAGTYAFRVAGPLLGDRFRLGPAAKELAGTATVVLLTALAAIAVLFTAGSPAGAARPAGVLVAGVLAWRRVPFIAVVVTAAAVTAVLRLAGLP
jgi:branched-subunit amino acid transport protein